MFSISFLQYAGEVDGNLIAFIFVLFKQYLLYSSYALFPVVNIFVMLELLIILFISFGVTFFIELSFEPVISHDAITSHNAILFFIKNSFFSLIVFGISSLYILDNIFQNLFCECA